MLTICNYHYIREHFDAKYPSIFGMTLSLFEKQLKLLKNQGDFISPNNLLNNLDLTLKSKSNYFLITFDDGLKEQYQYALPILEDLNIPAVFFANSINYEEQKVTTVHKIHLLRSVIAPKDFLAVLCSQNTAIAISENDYAKAQKIYIYDNKESAGLKYLLNFKLNFKLQEELISNIFDNYFQANEVLDQLYMSKDQLIDLSKKGYLGSHSHSHYPIGLLDEKSIRFELENSKKYFENLTKTKIEMIAYPYGSQEACTNQVANVAREVGYKLGFTTLRGSNNHQNNLLLLHRYDCNDLPGGKNYKLL